MKRLAWLTIALSAFLTVVGMPPARAVQEPHMVGRGAIVDRDENSFSADVPCSATSGRRARLEIVGEGNRFKLDRLETASCTTTRNSAVAEGTGVGFCNRDKVTSVPVSWRFKDGGETGRPDKATLSVNGSTCKISASGVLDDGEISLQGR